MKKASRHCEHVEKVMLMQCLECLWRLMASRVYRGSALKEEIVSNTRRAMPSDNRRFNAARSARDSKLNALAFKKRRALEVVASPSSARGVETIRVSAI
jgi:hypothetical protein